MPLILAARPDRALPHGQNRFSPARFFTYEVRRDRQQAFAINPAVQTACSERVTTASRRTSRCAPGDGSGATGCGGGGRAAMLDAGSASGGGTYSRDRAILWLFNAQERARVSCVLMQQHALDCVRCSARLDFRQSNLRLRKHQQSCSIALSTHSIHINAQNVLIGAVEWGWSRLLHTIEPAASNRAADWT